MQKEEKSIWDIHNEKKAALQKEWLETSLAFTKNRAALAASYGGQIPNDLQKELAQKETATLQTLNKRIREEENRFIHQIENYDLHHNSSTEKQTVNKEEKAQEPEKPALTGGSRFFNSLGYEKLKAQEAPDRSKDKSIDRDER